MKQKILLRSFMFLALVAACTFQTTALASEVTGNLSSSGNNNTGSQQATNTDDNRGAHSSNPGDSGTPDNGTIAGSVGSTSTASGGGGNGGNNSDGNVLGAETAQAAPAETSPNTLSSRKSTAAPSKTHPQETVSYGTNASEDAFIPLTDDPFAYEASGSPAEAATAFGAFSQFTAANWFWIIVLSLLLLAVIAYIYNDEKAQSENTRLNY